MLELNLELFALQRSAHELNKASYSEPYEARVLSYFNERVGLNSMSAAHYVVLESLLELMKNALDAGATKLFISDNSAARASICIFDNGSGFSADFFKGEQSSLDYGEKLNGFLAINSSKDGRVQLGGHGRGLAQAYEVIKQYEGTVLCSNVLGDETGAQLEFRSSRAVVSALEIKELFDSGRQQFSSRLCQLNTMDELEPVVGAMLRRLSFLNERRKSEPGLSDKESVSRSRSLSF